MNLSERDRQSVWHPFTQHLTAKNNIAIVRGEDAVLYDDFGNQYIDAVSSWWTNLFGHSNKVIADSITNQLGILEHVIFAGFTHKPAVDLSEKLLNFLPDNQSKIFFSDNGSTAVEVALKMAIQYWHNTGSARKTIIAFRNAYHGDTFGAMSVGARGMFNQPFESFLFDVEFIDLPNADNLESVKIEFNRIVREKEVAAFIFEPLVQGSAGMLMYKAEHLDVLLTIAKKHQVLCIADEVMTGFGRTGKIFASHYLSNKPDIFCLSKGITGGFLPLGVTTCSQEIYDAYLSEDKLKTFFHGHSYTGNPIACAAANASMDLLSEAQATIADLVTWQSDLSSDVANHAKVQNFRQQGTIIAFDVITDFSSGYFNDLRDRLYTEFLNKGVLLRPLGNTVYVLPPYVINKQQLIQVYKVILEVLDTL